MERFKLILRKIFFLPPLPAVIVAILGFGFVLSVAIFEIEIPAVRYLSYFCSAYALVITITAFPRFIVFAKSVKQRSGEHPIVQKIRGTTIGKRFFGDVRSRTELSLYSGMFINFAYIGIKLFSGIYYRSVWFISLSVYYALLAIMRFILLRKGSFETTMETELKRYRLCGATLLLMSQALAGIVIFMVRQNKGFHYPGILIYAMAAYSFYSVINAIISLVKFRKHGSPVLSAAKAINLVAAMVSILSLETAMLAQFGGDDDPLFRKAMTAATGIAVCVTVVVMAIYMLWKSEKGLKSQKAKGEIENGQQENL